jgi:gas vesicle protein
MRISISEQIFRWHYYLISEGRDKTINTMNTTSKVITGFLTGTLLGVVAGLLAAPATGKKTRKDIQKKSKKLAKQLRGYVGMNATPAVKSSTSKNGKSSLQVS